MCSLVEYGRGKQCRKEQLNQRMCVLDVSHAVRPHSTVITDFNTPLEEAQCLSPEVIAGCVQEELTSESDNLDVMMRSAGTAASIAGTPAGCPFGLAAAFTVALPLAGLPSTLAGREPAGLCSVSTSPCPAAHQPAYTCLKVPQQSLNFMDKAVQRHKHKQEGRRCKHAEFPDQYVVRAG